MSDPPILAALKRAIHERFGLVFSAARGEAFVRSVERVAVNLTHGSPAMLLAKLQQEDGEVLAALAEELTIAETYFFRDAQSFVVIDRAVERALSDGRSLRIWSAGCSTGEEAYSIAIRVREVAAGALPAVEVIGSDVSRRALANAEQALYRPWSFRGVSAETCERWFEVVEGTELRRPIPEIRRLVRFKQANLLDRAAAPASVDLVFCRNVFIYFDAHAIESAVENLITALGAGGTLVLGPSDPLLYDARVQIDQDGGFVSYMRIPPNAPERRPDGVRDSVVDRRAPSTQETAFPASGTIRAAKQYATPATRSSPPPGEVVARARELADRGELAQARSLLAGAGDDEATLLLRALVARNLGDSASALRDVRVLTAGTSPPVLAHVLEAMLSVDVADLDGARVAIALGRTKLGALSPDVDLGNGTVAADAGATLLALEKRLDLRSQRRRRKA